MDTTRTDPRPLFRRAAEAARPVVVDADPTAGHLPTPCDMTVDELRLHLLVVLLRVGRIGRGEPAFDPSTYPTEPPEDWSTAWDSAFASATAAWSDDARLDATIELPWTTASGAQALGTYVAEVTAHTWDLARALERQVAWDDEVVALADATMRVELPMAERGPMWAAYRKQFGIPDEVEFPPPFADAVAVPDDAPLIDRFVAWTGRTP